ncbi:MAG: 23S rRNA (uracil(1939)-C(5))-methyltransferase RlmD, partial [Culicoidibacterales bacterium]
MNNKNVTVECIDLNQAGIGVSLLEGKKIFVENLLPTEKAIVEITKMRSKFGNGVVVERLNDSPKRIVPLCPVADTCGGCDLQHVSYESQLEFKQKHTEKMMKVQSREIELKFNKIHPSPQSANYRNRTYIPFVKSDKGIISANLYKRNSHEEVSIEKCFIQSEVMNDILAKFVEIANQYNVSIYNEKDKKGELKHLCIRESKSANEVMIIFITKSKEHGSFFQIGQRLVKEFPQIKSVIQNIQPENTSVLMGRRDIVLIGRDEIFDEILGLKFAIKPQSFYQINQQQTEKLYAKVMELAAINKTTTVLDFYCGIGTMALLAAQYAKKAIGIEIVEAAITAAAQNAELNKLENVAFYVDDVTTFMAQPEIVSHENVVAIVDPPRKGCSEEFLASLIKLNPEKIVYVSCNPQTLARDLKILSESGYSYGPVDFFDMFPQTMHVEAVVL